MTTDIMATDKPSTPGARARSQGRADRPGLAGWLFSAPFGLLYVVFLLVPLGYGLYLGFTDTTLVGEGSGALSLRNFREAFSDQAFWDAFGNTLQFTAITTAPMIVVPLFLALLVSTALPGQWLWRLTFFAPSLVTVTVVAMMWRIVYKDGDAGFLNVLLGVVGVGPVPWIVDPDVAMYSVGILTLWWTIGFNFLLYLAAIQGIPEHLYEAAAIDGAGPLRRLWHITIPNLLKVTVLLLILQVLASLKVFQQIFLLTSGGPDGSTRSAVQYIYEAGFQNYRLGYASALAFIFFIIILGVTAIRYAPVIVRRATKR